MNNFEIVEHTADAKIHVTAKSLELLFTYALQGMFYIMHPHMKHCVLKDDKIVCKELPIEQKIEIQSVDLNALLVDFLSECLTLSDINNVAYLDVQLNHFDNNSLKGILFGQEFDRLEGIEIKAVTYHDLHIVHHNEIWEVNIVFDI